VSTLLPDVFFEIHSDLPREAPGDDESTRRALSSCSLPVAAKILDVGCGPGGQSVVAAAHFPEAEVYAVDMHAPFLREVNRRAASLGVLHRVHPVRADMKALPFAAAGFDLVLAEGSAYVMGIEDALAAWRELLHDDGHIAFTELVWLSANPPSEAKTFFDTEYPSMTTPDHLRKLIESAGYRLIDHFTLPDDAWRNSYYAPMEARLEELRRKYAGDTKALAVIEESQKEVDIRRRYSDSYGYEFFVARL